MEKKEMGVGISYKLTENLIEGIINTSNPMDRNEDKKRIENSDLKFVGKPKIELNKNYYTGFYRSFKENKNILKDN